MQSPLNDRIEWVIERCRLLQAIGAEYDETKPFAGLAIGTGIHLEPKTVALLLTLQRGGAELVSTGNLNTTQQEACDYLAARGVRVVGGPTSDPSGARRAPLGGRALAPRPAARQRRRSLRALRRRALRRRCAAGRRRRRRAGCASSRCATASACRCS